MKRSSEDVMKYLTGPQVEVRYQKSYMTIYRWVRDDRLGFPKPMNINGRLLFSVADLDAFDAQQRRA